MDTPVRVKGSKTLAQAMFDSRREKDDPRDTITSTMLRTLCLNGRMPQAEFMRLYHERCARSNPGKSSFHNNFGRLVRWQTTRDGLWRSRHTYNQAACLAVHRTSAARNQVWFTTTPALAHERISPPSDTSPDVLLRAFTDGELGMIEQWCERALTSSSPDPDADTWHKLVALEIAYRSSDAKSLVPRLFAQVAQALRKAGTRFGDWYDNGCDDFDGPYLKSGDARAYEQLREIAAGQNMTVLELLDYERIQWGTV